MPPRIPTSHPRVARTVALCAAAAALVLFVALGAAPRTDVVGTPWPAVDGPSAPDTAASPRDRALPDPAAIAPDLEFASSPLPGVTTAGQPGPRDFAAFARAGYRTVVDLRMPGEPRGFDEAAAARAAGLEYVNIPFIRTTLGPEQIERFRQVMNDPERRPVLVHCVAANRVGGIMLPWLVLDRGLAEDDAMALAMRIGLRSPDLLTAGLEYARTQRTKPA
jgi:uncharacterized protein (TIGR01244 family)